MPPVKANEDGKGGGGDAKIGHRQEEDGGQAPEVALVHTLHVVAREARRDVRPGEIRPAAGAAGEGVPRGGTLA